MKIELIPATKEEIPVLRKLMQFYLYDIAALDHWDIRQDGEYGNPERIESFWVDGQYERFIIQVEGILAGFVLTSHKFTDDNIRINLVSEFFVLRRYRRTGVGRKIATRLFEEVGETWEISVMRSNTPAQEFWARIVSDHIGRSFREFTVSQDTDNDVIFRFNSAEFRGFSSVFS